MNYIEYKQQGTTSTTDATPTTVTSYTFISDGVINFNGIVLAMDTTGNTHCTKLDSVYKSVGGTISEVGTGFSYVFTDQPWTSQYTVSGSTINLTVTGAISYDITWNTTLTITGMVNY